MSEIEDPTPPVPSPEPIPSPDPAPPPNPGPDPPELTPLGSTPERQQDPGEHRYGGTDQEKVKDDDALEVDDEGEDPPEEADPWPGEKQNEDD